MTVYTDAPSLFDVPAGKVHATDPVSSMIAAGDKASRWAWKGMRGEILALLATHPDLTSNEVHYLKRESHPGTPVHSWGTRMIELRDRELVERVTNVDGFVLRVPFYDVRAKAAHPYRLTDLGRVLSRAATENGVTVAYLVGMVA